MGAGVGWDGGRHRWSQSTLSIYAVLSPNSPGELLCRGLDVVLSLRAAFLCSSERRRLFKCGLGGCVTDLTELDVEII